MLWGPVSKQLAWDVAQTRQVLTIHVTAVQIPATSGPLLIPAGSPGWLKDRDLPAYPGSHSFLHVARRKEGTLLASRGRAGTLGAGLG